MSKLFNIRHLSIDFSDHSIFSNGVELHIDQKAVEVLQLLVNKPCSTVTTETFMETVWVGKPSSQEVVPAAISRLRKIFKLAGFSDDLIVTVHKRGYRYEPPVEETAEREIQTPAKPGSKYHKWIIPLLLVALLVSLVWNFLNVPGQLIHADLSDTAVAAITEESESNTTQIYFLRHAEQIDIGIEDSPLSEVGKLHADYWKTVFQNIQFDRVYATKYVRNTKTAEIITAGTALRLELYSPMSFEVRKLIAQFQGQKVLIIGHSNTIPDMVNRLINETRYSSMPHDNYNLVFIVTVNKNGDTSSTVLQIEMPTTEPKRNRTDK